MLVASGLVEQRCAAVREVLEGASAADVARRNGVARQTVHDCPTPTLARADRWWIVSRGVWSGHLHLESLVPVNPSGVCSRHVGVLRLDLVGEVAEDQLLEVCWHARPPIAADEFSSSEYIDALPSTCSPRPWTESVVLGDGGSRHGQTALMAFGSVCVFAGSSPGARPSYAVAARALGSTLAAAGTRMVFGGASVGLMGAVADAALAAGGEVVGVIPEHLVAHEVAHPSLDTLEVVASMHDRKRRMADLADAFVVLPGGLGTLEEAFEVLTWTQLALHEKPLGFLDVDGYFGHLSAFLDHAAAERFMHAEHRAMAAFDDDAARLLRRLETFAAPVVRKWLDR